MKRKVRTSFFVLYITIFFTTQILYASDSPLGIKLSNDDFSLSFKFQYRLRFEYTEGKDLMDNTSGGFLSHRARFGFLTGYKDYLKLRFDVQDVRFWGEEENTLSDYSADGFDMHQAYMDIRIPGKASSFILGRQEITLDNHRLIGNVDWTQQARSFDALAFDHNTNKWGVFLGYAKLSEADIVNFDETDEIYDSELPFFHVHIKPVEEGYVSFVYIHESFENLDGRHRSTVGPYFKYKHNGFHVNVEGYYQFGKESTAVDYASYLAALRLGYTFQSKSKPGILFWYDYLSGDDDPEDDENNVFHTLYATNHKFYGYMDFFINIPRDTFGLGLQDIGVSGTCRFHEKIMTTLDLHYFLSAEKSPGGNDEWGTELDFTFKTFIETVFTISAGFGIFWPGDAIEELRGGGDTELWGYIMSDVKF